MDGTITIKASYKYVPLGMGLRIKLLREAHDVTAGHSGLVKTLAALTLHFFWPGMSTDVKAYVSVCDVCARNKALHRQTTWLVASFAYSSVQVAINCYRYGYWPSTCKRQGLSY